MSNPRDPFAPISAMPVNVETGMPITDYQARHMQAIREAGEALYEAMHNADGSTMPGHGNEHAWSRRRMALAATHIETALMFARKAALE